MFCSTWNGQLKSNLNQCLVFRLLLDMFTIYCYGPECYIYCRKNILQITQLFQYRCAQIQYRFAVISEALSTTVWLYLGYCQLTSLVCIVRVLWLGTVWSKAIRNLALILFFNYSIYLIFFT